MRPDGVWRAYNDGTGARRWYIARTTTDGTREECDGADGRLRRFGSSLTADREAARLNAARRVYRCPACGEAVTLAFTDEGSVALSDGTPHDC